MANSTASLHRVRIHLVGAGLKRLLRHGSERIQGCESYANEQQRDCYANVSPSPSRDRALGDPPLGRKQPQAIGEMPRSSNDADHIKQELPRYEQLMLNFSEC